MESDRGQVVQPIIDTNDDPLHESEVNRLQLYDHNRLDLRLRDHLHPTPRVSNIELESSNIVCADQPAPALTPPLIPQPREQVPQQHQKDKRVKKRDKRHSKKLVGGRVESDTSVPKIKNRPPKNAKGAAPNPRAQPPSTPLPPRDPALDLQPGFQSDKARVA